MSRLSNATLASLPANIARPAYDRAAVKAGVVHLGIGAFHRAHQAVVFDRALAAGDLRWGIVGASLRSPGVRDQLNPQDGLYTLVERDGDAERLAVIGVVQNVVVGPENPDALVAALASPDTHIVTLTVTEKGYWLDPVSGKLMVEAEDVVADISNASAPRTAIGFVVRDDGGEDVFVHISAVEQAGLTGLAEGQPLEFTLVDRGGRISATDLKIEGEPLPVEDRGPRPAAGGPGGGGPARQLTGEKASGTVKFFNAMKGFGFIQRDDGQPDAFVHISAVERAGMTNLNEGDRLEFELEVDRRGKYAAVNLTPLS